MHGDDVDGSPNSPAVVVIDPLDEPAMRNANLEGGDVAVRKGQRAQAVVSRAKKGEPLASGWAIPAFEVNKKFVYTNGGPEVDAIDVRCLFCNQSLVVKKAGKPQISWTTCGRHIKCKHGIYDEAELHRELAKLSSLDAGMGALRAVRGVGAYKARSKEWKERVSALAKFVARHNQALHLGSKPAFVDFMRKWDARWPTISARTIGRAVAAEAEALTVNYCKMFRGIMQETNIALTSDIWTSINQDAYITVTAHYITKDWMMRSHTLGTHIFNVKHDADNIKKKLCRIREDFGMWARIPEEHKDVVTSEALENNPEDVYKYESAYDRPAITTDNGANISKAADMKDHFEWNKCICHCLHLAVEEGVNVPFIQAALQDLARVTNKIKRSPKEWKKFKCFQLECSTRRGERGTDAASDGDETDYGESDSEMNRAPRATEQGRVLKLLRVVPTRWSSVYYALQRALRLKTPLEEYLCHNPVADRAGAEDGEDVEEDEAESDAPIRRIWSLKWTELQALKEAMEPIRDVSMVMEGSKYVTSSTVLLHIIRLLYGLWGTGRIQDQPLVFQMFVKSFKRKLLDLVDDVNQFYSWAMCAFLDGRHKELTWLDPVFQNANDWPKVTSAYPSLRDLRRNLRAEVVKMVSAIHHVVTQFLLHPCVQHPWFDSPCTYVRGRSSIGNCQHPHPRNQRHWVPV